MKAPPPTPELCGSTSDSIAWTAIAASTALPPRFRTLSPACAAKGLAAMTNGSLAGAAALGFAVGHDCAAGATVQEPRVARARAGSRWRKRRMATRLAQREWRFKTIPLERRAG